MVNRKALDELVDNENTIAAQYTDDFGSGNHPVRLTIKVSGYMVFLAITNIIHAEMKRAEL